MSGIRRSRVRRFGSTPVILFFLVTPGILVFGCAGKTLQGAAKPSAEEKADRDLREKLAKQTAASRQLDEKVAQLQLQILERETQMREVQKKLDETIQEVVRAKAKLHSLESKAEAASTMAEAEIALKSLRARAAGQEKGLAVTQVEHLLKMSAAEFEKENYGGALYLTGQAKNLIKAGEARLMSREGISMRAGEVLFAVPLHLRVLRRSNVREGPGLDFKVLFTLEKGAALVGQSYKGQWVRVKDQNDRGGWIFRTLVHGW
ncbi:MAG: SH3 domain-containing protein [Candidatus Methylomirabilales bacterium]